MTPKRYAVTGSGGQLGRSLVRCIEAEPGRDLDMAWSHGELDITDEEAVVRAFDRIPTPLTVINAAGFTAVDRCEGEPETAYRVNRDGPGILARVCQRKGHRFAHVSTDYVFDGKAERPYAESATTAPISVYGRSKLEGEERVRAVCPDYLVVRTSWVFGPGHNFAEAILRQAVQREKTGDATPMRVVDDQEGAPTYAADLAAGLLQLLDAGATGLYHLSNAGSATWWQFARAILDRSGHAKVAIDTVATGDLNLPASRPARSLLDCSRARALGIELRPWQHALEAYLASSDRPDQ